MLQDSHAIDALIADRAAESDVLEFKEQIDNKEAARLFAALANHRGGCVVFGIREEASRAESIAPIDLDGTSERLANVARDNIDEPLVLGEVRPIYVEERRGVLVVKVDASNRAPHFVSGQGFTRSGPTTRPMSAHEIGALFARRGESFLQEFGLEPLKPADVVARIDSERREKGVDNKGRIKTDVHHELVLTNRGGSDAYQVTLTFLDSEGNEARQPRLLDNDFPIEILRADTDFSVPLSVNMGPGRATIIEISWLDDAGERHDARQSISV